ncbi:MAG: phosphatase PAP2 family protein, partial [Phycisphaerae bacterium]|nr:phosphatase PAP2 family protein [Saprospiraceae bacterium]
LAKPGFKGLWGKIVSFTSGIPNIFRILGSVAVLLVLLVLAPLAIRNEFWTTLGSHVVLISFLLVLCLVSLSLIWTPGQRIDVRILLFLNLRGKRSAFWDGIMLTITQIGSGIFAFLFAAILGIAGDQKHMYTFLLGSVSLLLLVEFLKFLFQRSRPYVVLNSVRVVGSQDSGRSFPSGHTSQAFFMATFMTVNFDLHIAAAIAFFATAFLVAITRMYVGMHYPRDVLGGALLGVSWGLIGVLVTQFIFQVGF